MVIFSAGADPQGKKVLVSVVDNAGWHVAKRLILPPNVVLYLLPPCTPKLQLVKSFRPLVRKSVANRSIARMDQLRAILWNRLAYLANHWELVQPVIRFRWTLRLE